MSTVTARNIVELQAQKYTNAVRQGDAAQIAHLHTTNVRVLPPENDMLQGRAAIQSYYQTLLDYGVKDMHFETIEAEFLGELAIREIGLSIVTHQSADGTTQELKSTYVVFWEQEDGEYKVDVDIWNH